MKIKCWITIKLDQNPKLIAKVVTQTNVLGANLETIDKNVTSLLNWQSSIQNELEAKLITGKQINLEKASYAALNRDYVNLMNEWMNQLVELGL